MKHFVVVSKKHKADLTEKNFLVDFLLRDDLRGFIKRQQMMKR